ncbi:MAG TPA: hypothetical protein VJP86_10375 [Vicinamibacterales bacterium]|nr:hypothetical protein [Vicinamibacterales bacterium]
MKIGPLVLAVTAVVVVLTVAAGVVLIGSPEAERRRQADRQRVGDLQSIATAVDVYWTERGTLPPSLAALVDEGRIGQRKDPVTAAPYEFRAIDNTHYELCAEFQGTSADDAPEMVADFWQHGKDRRCFRLEAKRASR